MKKQKEKQVEVLNKLLYYIDVILNNNNKNTENILRQAQEDKKDIVREIKKIKREIDEL
jgi:hypothetical protein